MNRPEFADFVKRNKVMIYVFFFLIVTYFFMTRDQQPGRVYHAGSGDGGGEMNAPDPTTEEKRELLKGWGWYFSTGYSWQSDGSIVLIEYCADNSPYHLRYTVEDRTEDEVVEEAWNADSTGRLIYENNWLLAENKRLKAQLAEVDTSEQPFERVKSETGSGVEFHSSSNPEYAWKVWGYRPLGKIFSVDIPQFSAAGLTVAQSIDNAIDGVEYLLASLRAERALLAGKEGEA